MINPLIPQIISYLSAFLTIISLWKAPKNRNWWAIYVVSSVMYIAVMLYNGLLEWAVIGVFLTIVGWKNYVGKT